MSLWSTLFGKKKQKPDSYQHKTKQEQDVSGLADNIPKQYLDTALEQNIQMLLNTTGNSTDIVYRNLKLGKNHPIQAVIVTTDGLIDEKIVDEFLLSTLLNMNNQEQEMNIEQIFEHLEKNIIPINGIQSIYDWNALFYSLLSGDAILLIDGSSKALAISVRGGERRAITEPTTERTIRGPKDAFTEDLRTNTSLIRRRIRNPHLWAENLQVGEVAKTDIVIMYIKGIANDGIIQELKKRLNRINVDKVLDTGSIEEFIEDETFTFFPTVYHTERPDVVASNLTDGKIAIIVNGSPFVLTVPVLFVEFFQAADDYYNRFDISMALRFLRVSVFFISLIGPATYVAVTTFHQEMVPTLLIVAIAAQREAVPFPAFIEALLMEITFEILREAGLRLPKNIGQAVSIVGALVIGQSAVQANIVSPAMVIVVSFTAIANFAIPSISAAISTRLIRFIIMFLAAFMGFYGIAVGFLIMVIHLCSLRSFGIPYMQPLAPLIPQSLSDTIIRLPLWSLKKRPRLISQKNVKRMGNNLKPSPPNDNENSKNKKKE